MAIDPYAFLDRTSLDNTGELQYSDPITEANRIKDDQYKLGAVAKGSGADVAVTSGPAYVYAVTVYATAANSYVNLHDAASATTGTQKIEVGEATQYETTRQVYDPPVYFKTAVYADVTNGAFVVEYR